MNLEILTASRYDGQFHKGRLFEGRRLYEIFSDRRELFWGEALLLRFTVVTVFKLTADRLAQLVEHRTAVREVASSNLDRTNTEGLKIIEKKVLPL